MKRTIGIGAIVLVALVVLAASAHASAGPEPHSSNCLACTLCSWMNALVN
jgi:hypothetical protein